MSCSGLETPPLEEVSSCFICNQGFTSDRELADHLIDHTKEEKFVRLLAELEAKNEAAAKAAAKAAASKVSFQTNHQGPEFMRASFSRNSSSRKKPIPLPAEPEVWEIMSDEDESRDNHMSAKKKPKVNSFRLLNAPNTLENSPFRCQACTSVFTDNVAFRQHLLEHGRPRPYMCHICKKSFAYKSTLRQHLYLHIGNKAYECRYCHKTFTIKSIHRRHEEVHELEQLQEKRKRGN